MARKESPIGRWRRWADRFIPSRRKHGEASISARSLGMMDTAMQNLKNGQVGKPIAPELLEDLARSE